MSMNKVLCNNGRLTLHGDFVVYHQDGVEFSLEGDQIPGFLKGSRKGNVFITTQKVIFAPTAGSNYGSFSMNFHSIRNVEVKQPMFGANYVKGDVISEPDGGWQGRGSFKVTFNSGGAIEFAQHFKHAVANAHRPGSQPPPPVPGQPLLSNGNAYTYHNAYQPQPAGYYAAYPPPPPAGYPGYPGYTGYPPPVGVVGQPPPYQPNETPPPYPGQAAPSAPPPSEGYSSYAYGDAKAREAYSTGQNVYVPSPQPPPPYAPPPYSASDKKNV